MNIEERVLAYLKNELSEADRAAFDDELTESRVLRSEVVRLRGVLDSLAASSAARVLERVNAIIKNAIVEGASDIHLTPEPNGVWLRFRVDGVLREADVLPLELHQALVDEWKALTGMDLHERRLPQDGRVPVVHAGKPFDLRVNILPTLRGERVTVRIFARDADAYTVKMDALGLSNEQAAQLEMLANKTGLLLVTGPAGGGKTTLAYALLQRLVSLRGASANILTAEDPVELEINGVSQCGANKAVGLSLADVIRGFGNRADPDIVYLSNLRDPEVAQLAADLAATGRLVIGGIAARGAREARAAFTGTSDNAAETAARHMVINGVVTARLARRGAGDWEPHEPNSDALNALGLTPADGPFRRPASYRGRVGLYEVRDRNEIGDNGAFGEPHTGDLRASARAAVVAGVTTAEEAVRALAL